MGPFPLRSALALALLLVFGEAAAGQEFRIFTRVTGVPLAASGEEPKLLSRSLTLFHAGTVYDFVAAANEVTVFDPGNRRFTVLNTSRGQATRIDFDQLERMIEASRQETGRYVAGGQAGTAAGSLQFQIDPRFEERFDADAGRLVLQSRYLTYDVRCAAAPSDLETDAILNYADWTARLNHALQPQALFPAARIALDDSLRKKRRIPFDVELTVDFGAPLHLRAEHRIDWQLHSSDRALINKWQQQLRDARTEFVSFSEYQRTALAAKPAKRE
ncbi:MAG: hypothetical protein WD069_02570 [Planctomycetales bacterium]